MSVVRTFGRMAIPWSTILQLGKSDFQNSWSSVCPETPLSDRNMNWNSWRNLFLFYAIQMPSGQFEWISSTGNTGMCWVVPSLHHRRDLPAGPACVASFYRRICERESGMLLGRKNCLLPDGPCPPPQPPQTCQVSQTVGSEVHTTPRLRSFCLAGTAGPAGT